MYRTALTSWSGEACQRGLSYGYTLSRLEKTGAANYYMNTILEKNWKHCVNRRRTRGSVIENKMVEDVGSLTRQSWLKDGAVTTCQIS